MSLWTIFMTGLTTGGLTCVAVQGGLLVGYLATRKGESGFHWKEAVAPTAAFLAAKLAAYTLLGALLGALGSVFTLSLGLRVSLQIAVGLFMIIAALQLLNVHPFFQRFQFRTPGFLRRVIRSSATGSSLGTPILLGLLTIFIPCGVTQAMEVYAIGTGYYLDGAAALAVFVLGTIPMFFLVGVVAHSGLKAFHGLFRKAAATALLILGVVTINSGLLLTDSPLAFQNVYAAITKKNSPQVQPVSGQMNLLSQQVTIEVRSNGYRPKDIQLRRNVPVELKLVTNKTGGCSRAFTIPKYDIHTILPETGEEIVRFTPTEPGRVAFTCSMGMYSGAFKVL